MPRRSLFHWGIVFSVVVIIAALMTLDPEVPRKPFSIVCAIFTAAAVACFFFGRRDLV